MVNGEVIRGTTRQRKKRQACVAGGGVVTIVLPKRLDASFLSYRFEAENKLSLVLYKTVINGQTEAIAIKKPVQTYRFILFKWYNFLNIFQKISE